MTGFKEFIAFSPMCQVPYKVLGIQKPTWLFQIAARSDLWKWFTFHPENSKKSCKPRGSNVPVHFKSTLEISQAITGMHIWKGTTDRKDVTLQKQRVQFCHHKGRVGKCAPAQHGGWTQGRWPKISAKLLLHILKDAESNAELKVLDIDSLIIEPIQVNKAPKMCCRTYRAHGQI